MSQRCKAFVDMNQQHIQSYISLIQGLLACPSGEEWILLRQNEALVTPELVQVMEQVATQLAHQENLKEAKFLHNLAGQIHHMFASQTVQQPHDEDRSQAYLELIKALLDCPQGSEGELLAAHQELIGPGLVHMMQQVAAQMIANGDQEGANYLQHWATELNRLWVQQHDFKTILKPEPELKHPEYPSVITHPSPPPVQFPQPSPVKQPIPPAPSQEDEDIWAEPAAQPVPASPEPLPLSEQPPVAPTPPAPVQDLAPTPPQPDDSIDSPAARLPQRQIELHLETIAGALTKISETLTARSQPPTNPLWYMEVLERAYTGNWVLTSNEIHHLIGVQPTCPHGSEFFQRGCWLFVKAGKLGTQTAWRVKKEDKLTAEE